MKAALTAALLVLAMAVPALARAPERSLLPVARGQSAAVVTPVGLGAVRLVLTISSNWPLGGQRRFYLARTQRGQIRGRAEWRPRLTDPAPAALPA